MLGRNLKSSLASLKKGQGYFFLRASGTSARKHQVEHQVKHQVNLSPIQQEILKSLMHKPLSRKEIFTAINMSGDTRSFKRHIEPLLLANLVEMTVPDKPNSRIQKYRLTDRGSE